MQYYKSKCSNRWGCSLSPNFIPLKVDLKRFSKLNEVGHSNRLDWFKGQKQALYSLTFAKYKSEVKIDPTFDFCFPWKMAIVFKNRGNKNKSSKALTNFRGPTLRPTNLLRLLCAISTCSLEKGRPYPRAGYRRACLANLKSTLL